MLVRRTDLYGRTASFDPWKLNTLNIRIRSNNDGLMRLYKLIGHITSQREIIFIQKVVVNKDPFSGIGVVSNGSFPDKFGFADPFPNSVRMPFMA